MITTYKYYTEKNQRLAIRAIRVEDKIHITILKCSKRDYFSRRVARNTLDLLESGCTALIDNKKVHPELLQIPITSNWKKDFFTWASDTYYTKESKWIRLRVSTIKRKLEYQIVDKIPGLGKFLGKVW